MASSRCTSRAAGFDNELCLEAQTAAIRERVFPGYDPDVKQLVGVKSTDRPTVGAAREGAAAAEATGKGNRGAYCAAAIQLEDGEVVVGMNTPLLHAESAVVLSAIERLGGIPEEIDLLPESIIARIARLKQDILGGKSASLNVEEVLVALSMSGATNPTSEYCMRRLERLAGCEIHTKPVVGKGDANGLRKLRMNLTTDALPTSRGFYY